VSGVRSARIANDDVCLLRDEVDDLPFSFVTPLGADHHNGSLANRVAVLESCHVRLIVRPARGSKVVRGS
jgi:hypothetical protein